VRVAAGDPNIGVTEHLLYHGERHAVVEQERRGRVPLRVHAPVLQPGAPKDVGPFLPVTPGIDRLAIRLAEHETVIGPCSTCQRSFQDLRLLMLAEDLHQLRRDRNHLVPPLLDLAQDPFGLVQGLMLIPLLIGGYISSTLLMAATGKAAGRWRAAQLTGFAIVAGLAIDLIVCYWLQGFPSSKFWIVWPICSLIIAAVAFVAAILQKLIGAAGTLLTVIVIILLGNPSSGGANGVPFLPTFWRDIGPYLPPRNAYILLHHTIYFHGHGTT
jgi:hypothetical protein